MTENPADLALIVQYLNNTEDHLLRSQVAAYRAESEENEGFYQEVKRLWFLSERASILANVNEDLAKHSFAERLSTLQNPKVPLGIKLNRNFFLRLGGVAAILLMAITASLYFYSKSTVANKFPVYASDATPGGNKAMLLLADGRKISLSDIGNGDVAKQAGLVIRKMADGQLVYTVAEADGDENAQKLTFNTIETPKGGMWQVRLPDGTSVWLNAMSSLTYPISFTKGEKRLVTLKGEAYFEVAKDKDRPFVVKTAKQEIEVLGTHFNVNAYNDEAFVRTTLLEGSVRVRPYQQYEQKNTVLVPGEQLLLTVEKLEVTKVDADEAIDWKNGYFMFNNERQEAILKKLARWYNVEVQYADVSAKNVTYYGSVSRFDNVSKVLGKFEQTGEVRFEIVKNKITVYKVNDNN